MQTSQVLSGSAMAAATKNLAFMRSSPSNQNARERSSLLPQSGLPSHFAYIPQLSKPRLTQASTAPAGQPAPPAPSEVVYEQLVEAKNEVIRIQAAAADQRASLERELGEVRGNLERELGIVRGTMERKLGAAKEQKQKLLRKQDLMNATLLQRTTELLKRQGNLHMRGVIEYVEREEKQRLGIKLRERDKVWEEILVHNQPLAICLRSRANLGGVKNAGSHVMALYNNMSIDMHPAVTPQMAYDLDGLVMNQSELEEMTLQMMKCICEHYFISYKQVLDHEPAKKYLTQQTGLPEISA